MGLKVWRGIVYSNDARDNYKSSLGLGDPECREGCGKPHLAGFVSRAARYPRRGRMHSYIPRLGSGLDGSNRCESPCAGGIAERRRDRDHRARGLRPRRKIAVGNGSALALDFEKSEGVRPDYRSRFSWVMGYRSADIPGVDLSSSATIPEADKKVVKSDG